VLVGAFITDVANGTAATISPLRWQVFFIGDGLTGTASGSAKSFVIPTNATRLFLGVADSAGTNFNNTGSYNVTIDDHQAVGGVPEPATWTTVSLMLGFIAFRRRQRRN